MGGDGGIILHLLTDIQLVDGAVKGSIPEVYAQIYLCTFTEHLLHRAVGNGLAVDVDGAHAVFGYQCHMGPFAHRQVACSIRRHQVSVGAAVGATPNHGAVVGQPAFGGNAHPVVGVLAQEYGRRVVGGFVRFHPEGDGVGVAVHHSGQLVAAGTGQFHCLAYHAVHIGFTASGCAGQAAGGGAGFAGDLIRQVAFKGVAAHHTGSGDFQIQHGVPEGGGSGIHRSLVRRIFLHCQSVFQCSLEGFQGGRIGAHSGGVLSSFDGLIQQSSVHFAGSSAVVDHQSVSDGIVSIFRSEGHFIQIGAFRQFQVPHLGVVNHNVVDGNHSIHIAGSELHTQSFRRFG